MTFKVKTAALFGAALAALAFGIGTARAIDIQAMDWTALPADTDIAALYLLHNHNDGLRVNGTDIDGRLNALVALGRYMRYFDVAGHRAAVTLALPVGKLSDGRIGGTRLNESGGLGDITIATAAWLVNEPEERRYLAFTTYFKLPTGRYDRDKPLNLGTGRYSVALQLGGQTAISERFTVEATIDGEFARKNDDANALSQTLKTDPAYSFQGYLSYQVTAATTLSAGWAIYRGGDQSLDGVKTGFKTDRQEARLAATTFLNDTTTLFGQVTHDFNVTGGFKQKAGAMVRIAKLF